MKRIFIPALILLFNAAHSQNVGIGTGSPAAKLDITSTNSGVLIPRVALTGTNDVSTVPSPATSTLIYNTTAAGSGATAVVPGFYYWNGTAWVLFVDNSSLAVSTTVSNTSNANTLSTTVNGVTGATVPIINTNTLSLSGNTLTSDVNGVSPTQSLSGLTLTGDVTGTLGANTIASIQGTGMAIASLAANNVLQFNGTNWVNVSPASILGSATSNTLSLSGNTLTSDVNGVSPTQSLSGLTLTGDVTGTLGANTIASIQGTGMAIASLAANNVLQFNGTNWVNVTPASILASATTVSNTSSANTLSTTVNGVAGATVPIINSNTKTWTQGGGLSDVVNGQSANVTPASGTITNVLGYNSSGAPVYQATSGIGVTNTLSLSTNTLTSTVNGVAATSNAVSGVNNNSSANTLSTTVNGVTSSTVPIVNTIGNTSNANTLSTTVNGVTGSTVPIVNSVSNTSNTNNLSTTVNGVTGGNVNIINSNQLSLSGSTLTSTINGVASTGLNIASAANNIYNINGTLTGARTVTLGGNVLDFTGGSVGIGTASPNYLLDVAGSIGVANNNNTATNKLYLASGDANHYIYSTGSGGNSMYLGEYGGVYHFYNTATASDVLFINGTTINVPGLTASSGVYTDGSKNLTSTAPTSGQLGYWTRSGTSLYNTNQGDNVGIGLTGPGSKLDVNGAITTERNWLYLAGPSDLNHAVGNLLNYNGNDAEQFRFCQYLELVSGCNNVTAVHITGSNGYTGIGTTTPGYQLDVAGVVNVQGASGGVLGAGSRVIFATGGATSTLIEENWGMNLIGTATQPVKVYNSSLLVGYTSSGTNYGSGNAYVSGNVGIGTTSPGEKLDVYGAICNERNWLYLAGAGDLNHAIGNLANYNGNDAEQFRFWGFLDFYAAQTGAEDRILPSGYFGLGTTSPTSMLDVRGNINLNQNTMYISGNGDNNHHIVYNGTYDGPQIAGCSGLDIYAQCFGNLCGFHHSNVFSALGYVSFWEQYSSASGGYYYDVMNDLDAIDAIKPQMRKNPVTGLDMVGTRPESFPAGFTMKSSDSVPEDMVSYNKLTGLSLGGIRQLRAETKSRDEAQDARIDRLEKLVGQLTGKALGQMDFTATATAYKGMQNYVIMDARISPKSSIKIEGLANYEIIHQTEGSFEVKFKTPPSDDVKFTYSSKF